LTFLLVAGATAGPGSATDTLRARAEEIRAALPPSGAEVTPEVRQRIGILVAKTVDLPGMLRAALGPRWEAMTEKQRQALEGAFVARFRSSSGAVLDPYRSTEITYGDEMAAGAGVVRVPTRVVVNDEPVDIAYDVRRDDGEWRIVDIVVDGVSTVENYRASFARVIAKEGVEGLIRRLARGGTAADVAAGEEKGRTAP
jgi:ABC-type transporter MlaC component